MDACGATYIARWTSLHSRNVTQSIEEALLRKGFSFIEVISPCTTLYLRRNRLGDGVDMLQHYQDNSILKHGADTRETAIDFQGKIVVGKFVDKTKPTYLEAVDQCCVKLVGDDYQLYGKTIPEREAEEKAEKERIAARRAAMQAEEGAQEEAVSAKPRKAPTPKAAVKKAPAKAAAVPKAAKKAPPKAPAKPVKTKFQSKVMPAKQALAGTKKTVTKAPARKVASKAPTKKTAPKAPTKKVASKAPAKKVAPKAAPKKTRK